MTRYIFTVSLFTGGYWKCDDEGNCRVTAVTLIKLSTITLSNSKVCSHFSCILEHCQAGFGVHNIDIRVKHACALKMRPEAVGLMQILRK